MKLQSKGDRRTMHLPTSKYRRITREREEGEGRPLEEKGEPWISSSEDKGKPLKSAVFTYLGVNALFDSRLKTNKHLTSSKYRNSDQKQGNLVLTLVRGLLGENALFIL